MQEFNNNTKNNYYIIVGLGNPGKKYENTRHNSGFMALDYISQKFNCTITKEKFKALVNSYEYKNKKLILLKPQTYMNLSGESVLEAMSFYKVPPENTILIFDDVSLPVGKIRIRKNGSHGGQNGVKNILLLSKNNNFPRIKIGISNKPDDSWELSDWVLSKFTHDEQKMLNNTVFENVYSSLLLILDNKIDQAMNLYN